ncbi:hypothetical protein CJU89_1602 [Yarrowia sp. B02]|nr:hypothetical protein CJU89_1602 [Yarrowia sp. B02]
MSNYDKVSYLPPASALSHYPSTHRMPHVEFSNQDVDLLSKWSVRTLELFLHVRNLEIHENASYVEILDMATSAASVPIRVVSLTRTIFDRMTHLQLISWLESRDYVVLPKAKPMFTSAPGACYTQRRELLKFAKEDYVDHIAHLDTEAKYELEMKLADIFSTSYAFTVSSDPEQPPSMGSYGTLHRNHYQDDDLEMMWTHFFGDQLETTIKSREEKAVFVQNCIRVFAQGPRRLLNL